MIAPPVVATRFLHLFNLLGFFGTLRFLAAYLIGSPEISLNVRGASRPVWLRPRTSDPYVLHGIFNRGDCDTGRAGSVAAIVDAGANVGYATLFFAERYPSAKILSIEPDGANCALFRRNLAGFSNVVLIQAALWSKCTPLLIENPNDASCALRVVEANQMTSSAIPGRDVPAIIDALGLRPIDILKVDIEGAERQVFSEGTEQWIDQVQTLVIETHGPDAAQIVDTVMVGAGFSHLLRGEKHIYTRAGLAG
jgi:FkbM family methyltransferase